MTRLAAASLIGCFVALALAASITGRRAEKTVGTAAAQRKPEVSDEYPRDNRQLEVMAARIAELEARLTNVEQSTAPTQSPEERSDEADAGAVSNAGPEPRPEMRRRARVEAADSAWAGETRDSSWAPQTETQLMVAFDGGDFEGSTLIKAECRSTFCRLLVTHETPAALEAFDAMADKVPMGSMMVPIEGEAGTSQTVAYFVRPEFDSPDHPVRRSAAMRWSVD